MVSLVKWSLFSIYFTSRLTASLNFEIDFKTGRIKVTKSATICAACLQILTIISLTYQMLYTDFFTTAIRNAKALTDYVFLVTECTRIICVLLALVNGWTQRRTFIRLYNSFRRLYQHNPETVQHCRRNIVSKCLRVKISEILQVLATFYTLRNRLSIPLCIRYWNLFNLTTVLNGITTQYYVALASLRGRYFLLNRDLKALLTEARSLNTNQSAEFKTTCCSLADRLEKIARSQCEAQGLVERLVRTYQVQMMCMMTIYYLNLVGNLYIVLIFSKNWVLTKFWFNEEVLCFTFITVYYFIDCWISLYNTFYLLDAHEEMVQLLSERTLFQSALDKRLEAVVSRKNKQ